MGALGRGAELAGFRVVGVNELQDCTVFVAFQVTGVSVAVGDVSADATIISKVGWSCCRLQLPAV